MIEAKEARRAFGTSCIPYLASPSARRWLESCGAPVRTAPFRGAAESRDHGSGHRPGLRSESDETAGSVALRPRRGRGVLAERRRPRRREQRRTDGRIAARSRRPGRCPDPPCEGCRVAPAGDRRLLDRVVPSPGMEAPKWPRGRSGNRRPINPSCHPRRRGRTRLPKRPPRRRNRRLLRAGLRRVPHSGVRNLCRCSSRAFYLSAGARRRREG